MIRSMEPHQPANSCHLDPRTNYFEFSGSIHLIAICYFTGFSLCLGGFQANIIYTFFPLIAKSVNESILKESRFFVSTLSEHKSQQHQKLTSQYITSRIIILKIHLKMVVKIYQQLTCHSFSSKSFRIEKLLLTD